MRILYWQYFFTPPGGWGNRRSYDLARYWRGLGHTIWIVAGGTYFPEALRARLCRRRCFRTPEGIAIVYLPTPYHQRQGVFGRLGSFMRFTLWSWGILRRLRRANSVLIATVPPPFLPMVAAVQKKCYGHPFAVELYDAWPLVPAALGVVPWPLRPLLYALSRWSYRQARPIIALSPGIRSALQLPQALVSYNGTAPERFRRRKIPPFLPFRLVYAGTFGRVNALRFLLQVAQCLRAYPAIEFWLIGDGAEAEMLRTEAQALPQVRFFPPVPSEEIPFWLSEAHIGVSTVLPIPILSTNSANKFYDYLACGLVVGLNYGGWQAEFLAQAGCGFSALTPETFAQQVLRHYWNRALWEASAARARAAAERYFDRRKLAQALLVELQAC